MPTQLVLISHALCPYVQRAAIVLHEKGMPYIRRDIDLANKPDWFLACSPLGKTPVLLVDEAPIFESAVICEYLDEVMPPRLHPPDALRRAHHRSWIEFGSTVLGGIAGFYNAPDEAALLRIASVLHDKFVQVEAEKIAGPFFDGEEFSIVDAVFAPVFRYFDAFDLIDDFGILAGLPAMQAWRAALASRSSVQAAVDANYGARLLEFLRRRGAALSARMEAMHGVHQSNDGWQLR